MSGRHKPCVVCSSANVSPERILNEIRLVRCRNCTHVYADFVAEEILDLNLRHYQDVYENTFEVPDINMKSFKMGWFSIIAEMVTRSYGVGSVLDIGCGNGGLLLNFRDRGWQITGIDLSREASQFADKYGYRIITGLLEEVEIAPDSFDCVTATNVLEHIPEPVAFINKIMDIVKPGGIIYLNVPNYQSLSIRLGISKFFRNMPPHHCSYFTQKSLKALFSQQPLRDSVAKVRVRSYGIPELHYAFSRIVEKRASQRLAGGFLSSPVAAGVQGGKRSEKIRALVKRIAISSIYHAGRPFCCGDKLECTIVKGNRGVE